MATSAPYSILHEGLLEKARPYYLYDLGQPHNLFPGPYWDLVKKGCRIILVKGGVEGVRRPFDIGCWMRLNPSVMYACYSEVVSNPEMVLFANLGANLHVCLCGDLQVASA